MECESAARGRGGGQPVAWVCGTRQIKTISPVRAAVPFRMLRVCSYVLRARHAGG